MSDNNIIINNKNEDVKPRKHDLSLNNDKIRVHTHNTCTPSFYKLNLFELNKLLQYGRENSKAFGIRVPETLYEWLREKARENGVTVSRFITLALTSLYLSEKLADFRVETAQSPIILNINMVSQTLNVPRENRVKVMKVEAEEWYDSIERRLENALAAIGADRERFLRNLRNDILAGLKKYGQYLSPAKVDRLLSLREDISELLKGGEG